MKKMVLIIEDDQDMMDYFRIVLADPELDFLQASNGQEALSLLDAGAKADLILLDMVMPIMSGEEFFRILRQERSSNIPVIFSSVDETRALSLRSLGELQGIFLKGRPGRELKEMIKSCLV